MSDTMRDRIASTTRPRQQFQYPISRLNRSSARYSTVFLYSASIRPSKPNLIGDKY